MTDPRDQALQEASEWLVRLQEDGIPDADVEAWGHWMASSTHNARAFDDISTLWDDSAALTSTALDDAIRARQQAAADAARRQRRRVLGRITAIAAACGLIAVGVFALRPSAPGAAQQLVTAQGQRQHVVLADGSAVDLDAASRLSIDFSGRGRELILERGRAYFSVAHDPARPFRVKSGGIVSQALGTQFAVGYRAPAEVSVVVVEGRVQVSELADRGADAGRSVEAHPNERVRFSAGEGLAAPQPVNAALAAAWKEGSVVYQGETLASVIEDLNRYSRIPLRLEDPALGGLRVTGRWDSTSVDRWIDGLAHALDLQVIRRSDVILLTARKTAAGDAVRRPPAEPPPPRSSKRE
jgi:transmembrane sensor